MTRQRRKHCITIGLFAALVTLLLPVPAACLRKEVFASPSWHDIFKKPIQISSMEEWEAQPQSKRVAMMVRPSVLHLTILSSLSPLLFNGALGAWDLNSRKALQWTACMMSWHAVHNMINDYQDLNDDDSRDDSYRLAYGVHVLKQGFVSKERFFATMMALGMPGIWLSWSFRGTNLGPAFACGFAAMVLYTPLFKPFALGEVLVYLIWGPLMAGFGEIAATSTTSGHGKTVWKQVLTSPVAALMGTLATQMIFGKHTDKITKSNARTLPRLLGYKGALTACKITLFVPYLLLAWALSIGRLDKSNDPIMPLGSALAFLAFFREGLGALNVINKGEPVNGPTITTMIPGTLLDADLPSVWPLWFVTALGWHAVTFGYLALIGSGLEWLIKLLVEFTTLLDWIITILAYVLPFLTPPES